MPDRGVGLGGTVTVCELMIDSLSQVTHLLYVQDLVLHLLEGTLGLSLL
jgi:hypothetical protein